MSDRDETIRAVKAADEIHGFPSHGRIPSKDGATSMTPRKALWLLANFDGRETGPSIGPRDPRRSEGQGRALNGIPGFWWVLGNKGFFFHKNQRQS